jgi:programmed cell death protein 5
MDNLTPAGDVDLSELPEGFSKNGGPRQGGNDEQSQKKMAMEEQKAAILEQALSQEALARLGRIKLVKKEKALAVENQIVSMAMQGKLPGKINEPKLIELLERGSRGEAAKAGDSGSGITIQRKKYAFDSDEDDDNDDDLM